MVKAPLQNKLQAMVERLAPHKAIIAKAQAEVERVKGDFYGLCDEAFGAETYIIYGARKPYAGNRMVREMQEPRECNVEGLRAALPPEQFNAITKTTIDMKALDNALARGEIDSHIVSDHTTYGRKPLFLWTPTGARTEVKLLPGQLALVGSPRVGQEG